MSAIRDLMWLISDDALTVEEIHDRLDLCDYELGQSDIRRLLNVLLEEGFAEEHADGWEERYILTEEGRASWRRREIRHESVITRLAQRKDQIDASTS